MARPKKDKEINHKNIITLRLTDVELELVMKKAKSAGLTRSEYIRKCLLDGKIKVTHKVTAEFPELRDEMKQISWLLSNLSNNINQIAKYFNTGGLRSQEVTARLETALDAILQIQVDVTRMVGEIHGNLKTHYK
ncbi:plasmid mobilization protein [Lacrimispora indolis]|jgi:hypothetical protein|uniref:plasmid mobilization protein n=1 Tax=Lacrimispora indolis TaxID=69825 RepID=UPI000426B8D0|nr:plasmid mobilization relaxosome protein MobC [[Clostridium] methoxybenzovorans]